MRVAALVAHLRTALRLPIHSIQRYLADVYGLRLSGGSVVDLLHRVAAQGASAATQIRDQARQRPVVHADETGWREAGHYGYAWLLATPGGERSVERHQSRAGAVANALLGEDFKGCSSPTSTRATTTPQAGNTNAAGYTSCATEGMRRGAPVPRRGANLGRAGQGRLCPPPRGDCPSGPLASPYPPDH